MCKVGHSLDGSLCNQIQHQVEPVCVSGSRSGSVGGGRSESALGDSGRVCLSSVLSPRKGSVQGERSGLSQDDPHCARFAKHVMVLGPGQLVKSQTVDPSGPGGSGDSTLQRDLRPGPDKFESTCVAPRASNIQDRGFSEKWQQELIFNQSHLQVKVGRFC